VQELESAGAAGLTIEETLLPQAFGEAKAQLISVEEGAGKIRAALDARGDASLVIVGRTGAASITSVDDAIARAQAYQALGVDALMFTGVKTRADLQAIAAATTLPIVLGGPTEEMTDWGFRAAQRVRIAVQGHAPIAAATQAVHATLLAIRNGAAPKELNGLPSAELTDAVSRAGIVKKRGTEFLGLKK
jgi:carboxyvinyl-carboxyphosphonate phosphorylmutase